MRLPACPHCRSKVEPYDRVQVSPGVVEDYARCPNPDCPEAGASLVYVTQHMRTVGRKAEASLEHVLSMAKTLPAEKRAKLVAHLAKLSE